MPAGGVYVLELSSYQIDLTFTLDCDVAVLLNITPDHLDRYDGFEAYAASKVRLFEMQSASNKAIFSGGDSTTAICNQINRERSGRVLWVDNRFEELLGISVFAGEATIYGEHVSWQRDWPALQGPHNAENAGVAIGVCSSLDSNEQAIAKGLSTYPGLPHRMERIREIDGVLYVNDSKATNPTSTAPALAAYPVIHWILGGEAKTDELDACIPHLGHVKTAFTIGRDSAMLAAVLRPHVPVSQSITLEQAVLRASRAARAGETVLLSPACASFDQFRDYEDRGDQFRRLVEAL